MNIPARLSLAYVPVLLLAMRYADTLEISESNGDFWNIVFLMIIAMLLSFAPMVGVFLALFAKKPIQIILLVLLNISYYPIRDFLFKITIAEHSHILLQLD